MIDYDRYIISDDRVKIEVKSSMEPHPVSPHGEEDFGYQVVKNSIRQVWAEAVVAPGKKLVSWIPCYRVIKNSIQQVWTEAVVAPGKRLVSWIPCYQVIKNSIRQVWTDPRIWLPDYQIMKYGIHKV